MTAEFIPPTESLAFPVIGASEKDFPDILAEPLPVVVTALTRNEMVEQVFDNLPDMEIMLHQPLAQATAWNTN